MDGGIIFYIVENGELEYRDEQITELAVQLESLPEDDFPSLHSIHRHMTGEDTIDELIPYFEEGLCHTWAISKENSESSDLIGCMATLLYDDKYTVVDEILVTAILPQLMAFNTDIVESFDWEDLEKTQLLVAKECLEVRNRIFFERLHNLKELMNESEISDLDFISDINDAIFTVIYKIRMFDKSYARVLDGLKTYEMSESLLSNIDK